jgi:hypothetical protein
MWLVKIDLLVSIAGCPKQGVAAIDFRRCAGLEDGTDSRRHLQANCFSETVCRAFTDDLDEGANLNVSSGTWWKDRITRRTVDVPVVAVKAWDESIPKLAIDAVWQEVDPPDLTDEEASKLISVLNIIRQCCRDQQAEATG